MKVTHGFTADAGVSDSAHAVRVLPVIRCAVSFPGAADNAPVPKSPSRVHRRGHVRRLPPRPHRCGCFPLPPSRQFPAPQVERSCRQGKHRTHEYGGHLFLTTHIKQRGGLRYDRMLPCHFLRKYKNLCFPNT